MTGGLSASSRPVSLPPRVHFLISSHPFLCSPRNPSLPIPFLQSCRQSCHRTCAAPRHDVFHKAPESCRASQTPFPAAGCIVCLAGWKTSRPPLFPRPSFVLATTRTESPSLLQPQSELVDLSFALYSRPSPGPSAWDYQIHQIRPPFFYPGFGGVSPRFALHCLRWFELVQ